MVVGGVDDGGVGGVDGGGVGLVGGRERGQGQAWNILSLQHSATLQYSGCNSLQLEHSATLGLQTSAQRCNTAQHNLHHNATVQHSDCKIYTVFVFALHLYLHYNCICINTAIIFVFALQ